MARLAIAAALASTPLPGSPASARPAGGTIALTFDDLPVLSLTHDPAGDRETTGRLLQGLKRHRLPATGFVIAGKLAGPDGPAQGALLKAWLGAGMRLGNHSYSHRSPDEIGAAAFTADIERAQPYLDGLRPRHARSFRWFRFPRLETGASTQARSQIDTWLAVHRYRIAPVTLNADDWIFAEPYDDAVAQGDRDRQRHIVQLYLAYTDRTIGWYQLAGRTLFGRTIPLVMLLHATRLNADCIDRIAGLLKRHHLKAISLDKAVRDPAYRTPDPYVGPDGIDWLER